MIMKYVRAHLFPSMLHDCAMNPRTPRDKERQQGKIPRTGNDSSAILG